MRLLPAPRSAPHKADRQNYDAGGAEGDRAARAAENGRATDQRNHGENPFVIFAGGQQQISRRTAGHDNRHEDVKPETAGTHKNRGWQRKDLVGDWGGAVQFAQVFQLGGEIRGIQETMPEDRLGNANRGNYSGQRNVHEQKFPQVFVGADQRVGNKHQWDVIEIELKTQQAIKQVRRDFVENLNRGKPDEEPEEREKSGAKKFEMFSANLDQERG